MNPFLKKTLGLCLFPLLLTGCIQTFSHRLIPSMEGEVPVFTIQSDMKNVTNETILFDYIIVYGPKGTPENRGDIWEFNWKNGLELPPGKGIKYGSDMGGEPTIAPAERCAVLEHMQNPGKSFTMIAPGECIPNENPKEGDSISVILPSGECVPWENRPKHKMLPTGECVWGHEAPKLKENEIYRANLYGFKKPGSSAKEGQHSFRTFFCLTRKDGQPLQIHKLNQEMPSGIVDPCPMP